MSQQISQQLESLGGTASKPTQQQQPIRQFVWPPLTPSANAVQMAPNNTTPPPTLMTRLETRVAFSDIIVSLLMEIYNFKNYSF